MTDSAWRKSSYSNNGDCVELANLGDTIGVRDSKHPNGDVLTFSRCEIAAWIDGIRAGEYDDLT